MDRIRYFAEVSVQRALGFTGIGLATLLLGLSFDPRLALQVVAAILGITGGVLIVKSLTALRRNYRRTEVWILLGRTIEFPEHRAQQIIGSVLKDTYRRYARLVLAGAFVAWVLSVLYGLASSF